MWIVNGKIAAVACAVSGVLSGLLVGSVLSWKHRAEIAELKEEHRQVMMKGWEAAAKVNAEVTEQYHEDIATIATRPPGRTVLLCPDRAVLPGAAAGTGAEASPGLPQESGNETRRDIGSYIAAEADRADRCAAQLNSLIDWVNKVRKPDK